MAGKGSGPRDSAYAGTCRISAVGQGYDVSCFNADTRHTYVGKGLAQGDTLAIFIGDTLRGDHNSVFTGEYLVLYRARADGVLEGSMGPCRQHRWRRRNTDADALRKLVHHDSHRHDRPALSAARLFSAPTVGVLPSPCARSRGICAGSLQPTQVTTTNLELTCPWARNRRATDPAGRPAHHNADPWRTTSPVPPDVVSGRHSRPRSARSWRRLQRPAGFLDPSARRNIMAAESVSLMAQDAPGTHGRR